MGTLLISWSAFAFLLSGCTSAHLTESTVRLQQDLMTQESPSSPRSLCVTPNPSPSLVGTAVSYPAHTVEGLLGLS